MFERFTNKARHVVVLAQEEARRLNHNYIGTEHLLLGLMAEPRGLACRALEGLGLTLDGTREETVAIVARGKKQPSGHIPFTPRAKKTLELALREALRLHHDYIGTEHILLGLIREGDGVAANILQQHASLLEIRAAVLDMLPAAAHEAREGRRWLRRFGGSEPGEPSRVDELSGISATPAADATLTQASKLAGTQSVGSHHLLLAALADPDTAAARALTQLGIDLDRAQEALRTVDVTGTSDEPPEEAGRRQMVIRLGDDAVILEAADPRIVAACKAAIDALGPGEPANTIRGNLAAAASLTTVWQAMFDSFTAIQHRASPSAPDEEKGSAGGSGPGRGSAPGRGSGSSESAA